MPFRYALAALLLLAPATVHAQTTGSCAPGVATAKLSVSDVQAALYNEGNLFWDGGSNILYEAPKGGGVNATFAAGIWTGGLVNGELRTAAADFAEPSGETHEFWPGPLDAGASLPDATDCSAYDRFYRVTAPELAAYDAGGPPSASLAEWPVGLGAPAVDASGVPVVATSREQTVNLAAGERPVVYGTETFFWVMNDVGNVHRSTQSEPLGIEVRVSAFSINDPDEAALDQSTVYRYEIVNRSATTIEDFRFGFWTAFALGDAIDDYSGSDSGRSMFYVYNADNDDFYYGTAPPALGIDILSGSHGALAYVGSIKNIEEPHTADDYYEYLSSIWQDGTPMTRFGFGYNPSGPSAEVTTWHFDGDPTATDKFWTAFDVDPAPGYQPRSAGNARGVISAAPVDLVPGASHTVDIALVFARGTDAIDSVTELFAASDLVQSRYDDGSLYETTSGDLGLPPATAPALFSPADGTVFMPPETVVLDWTPVADVDGYRIEFSTNAAFQSVRTQAATAPPVTLSFDALPQDTFEPIYWRVVPTNASGDGPSSETRSFTYGFEFAPGVQRLSNGQPAFLEVAGPDGADPCGDAAGSTFGCDEAGGNAVYVPVGATTADVNGTGAYALTALALGPEDSLPAFAPNDYEIRFTADGSIGYHLFGDGPGSETHRVPFEVWDIGIVPLGADGVPAVNDPSDDRQLVPILFSDDEGNGRGVCAFDLGEVPAAESPLGVPLSDRIYGFYPTTTYADFDAAAAPLVDAAPDDCYDDADGSLQLLFDTDRRPIQRVVVADLAGTGSVADLAGVIIRLHTTDPQPVAGDAAPTASPLALTVAPNPSRGAARVSFTLPTAGAVRVRVLDVLGREVARLADGERADGSHAVTLPLGLAAGIYVVTIEAGDVRASRTLTVVR